MYKHMKCYILNNKQSSVYNRHKRRQLSTFLMVFFSGNRLLHLFEYIGWYKLVRFSIKVKSFSMANSHQHTRLFIFHQSNWTNFAVIILAPKWFSFSNLEIVIYGLFLSLPLPNVNIYRLTFIKMYFINCLKLSDLKQILFSTLLHDSYKTEGTKLKETKNKRKTGEFAANH